MYQVSKSFLIILAIIFSLTILSINDTEAKSFMAHGELKADQKLAEKVPYVTDQMTTKLMDAETVQKTKTEGKKPLEKTSPHPFL